MLISQYIIITTMHSFFLEDLLKSQQFHQTQNGYLKGVVTTRKATATSQN